MVTQTNVHEPIERVDSNLYVNGHPHFVTFELNTEHTRVVYFLNSETDARRAARDLHYVANLLMTVAQELP